MSSSNQTNPHNTQSTQISDSGLTSDYAFLSDTEIQKYPKEIKKIAGNYKTKVNKTLGLHYEQFVLDKISILYEYFQKFETVHQDKYKCEKIFKKLNEEEKFMQKTDKLELDLKGVIKYSEVDQFLQNLQNKAQFQQIREYSYALENSKIDPNYMININGEIKLSSPDKEQLLKQIAFCYHFHDKSPQIHLVICNKNRSTVEKNAEKILTQDFKDALNKYKTKIIFFYSPSHIDKLCDEKSERIHKFEKEFQEEKIKNNNLKSELENTKDKVNQYENENKNLKKEVDSMKEMMIEMQQQIKAFKLELGRKSSKNSSQNSICTMDSNENLEKK